MRRSSTRRLLGFATGLALLLAPTPGSTQTPLIDEGTFRILIGGRDVGSETFTIRRTGSDPGGVINARGSVTIDTAGVPEELNSVLQVTGAALQPSVYNLRIRHGSREEQIAGRLTAGRFIARIVSPTGEELREYLASNNAVLVDQGIVHQYYFLARRMRGETMRIPVIIPRQGRQVSASVEARGEESIALGNQRTNASHLVITYPSGDPIHLWVDSQSRVLRLEIPARNLTASRAAPPR